MTEHKKLDFEIKVSENVNFLADLLGMIGGRYLKPEAALAYKLKEACQVIDELRDKILSMEKEIDFLNKVTRHEPNSEWK